MQPGWNRMPASDVKHTISYYCFSPVSAIKRRVSRCSGCWLKSNIWLIELAMASNEPVPMRVGPANCLRRSGSPRSDRSRCGPQSSAEPGRDHNQWQARAVSATSESVRFAGLKPGNDGRRRAASSGAGQSIGRTRGLVHDRPHLMVVPSVGVVVHDRRQRCCPR